jgi:hypothetical protein
MISSRNPVATVPSSPLAWGTIGWDGDGGKFYDLGSADDDGSLLVRVTLFRGRDQSKVLAQDGMAQGQQLLSKIASTFVHIPPRGSRVLVALPEPFGSAPGGSMIIAADNANPVLIGNLKPGEAAVAIPGSKGRLLFKNTNDAIVMYTEDVDGVACSIYVGKDKIQISNAACSITLDATGISMTASAPGSFLGPGGLTIGASDGTTTLSGQLLNLYGQLVSLAGSVATCLGQNCTPVPGGNNALVGPTGLAGLPAPTVYVSNT